MPRMACKKKVAKRYVVLVDGEDLGNGVWKEEAQARTHALELAEEYGPNFCVEIWECSPQSRLVTTPEFQPLDASGELL